MIVVMEVELKMPLKLGVYTGWLREKDYAEWDCCSGGPNWRLELVDEDNCVIVTIGTRAKGTIFEPFLGKRVSIKIKDLLLS